MCEPDENPDGIEAICEGCGSYCDYDPKICLCPKCRAETAHKDVAAVNRDVIPPPGVCPGCGEEHLAYGSVLSDSGQRLHPVECPDCGWEGWEVYEVSFSCFLEKVEN